MDLRNLRQKLAELTGRYDLVKEEGGDPWVDNGADWFLNKGQRLLDRLFTPPGNRRRFVVQLALGDYKVVFRDCRTVREVWVATNDGRWELEPCSINELRSLYAGDFTQVTPGTPIRYALNVIGLAPEQRSLTGDDFDGMNDWQDLEFGDGPAVYNGIIVMAPPDQPVTCSVWGDWFSPALTDDTDLTWWSVNHSETFLKAAAYELEAFLRNRTGAADWLAGIQADIQGLEYDQVEQESQHFTEMRG